MRGISIAPKAPVFHLPWKEGQKKALVSAQSMTQESGPRVQATDNITASEDRHTGLWGLPNCEEKRTPLWGIHLLSNRFTNKISQILCNNIHFCFKRSFSVIPKSLKKIHVLLFSTFMTIRNRNSLGLLNSRRTTKGLGTIVSGIDSVPVLTKTFFYYYVMNNDCLSHTFSHFSKLLSVACDSVLSSKIGGVCQGSFWESFLSWLKEQTKLVLFLPLWTRRRLEWYHPSNNYEGTSPSERCHSDTKLHQTTPAASYLQATCFEGKPL